MSLSELACLFMRRHRYPVQVSKITKSSSLKLLETVLFVYRENALRSRRLKLLGTIFEVTMPAASQLSVNSLR